MSATAQKVAPSASPSRLQALSGDVRLQVLALSLEPAVTLARVLGLPLRDLQIVASATFFRDLKRRGYSMPMMARRMGKSLRTVASISRKSQSEAPPVEDAVRKGLVRQVSRALSREGAMTRDELGAALGEGAQVRTADLDDALVELSRAGVIELQDRRWTLTTDHVDLVSDEPDVRLESLRHFLGAVTQVVYRRFFVPDDPGEAFARVFTFSVTPERLAAMREELYDLAREGMVAAEHDCRGRPDAVEASIALCVVERPTDPRWGPRRS